MLSLRPNHLAFLFLFHCLFLALSPVNAVPIVIKRQSDGQATTVMTQSTTSTPAGDMTQTCVIKLTPITDNNGNVTAVQEVKTCTLTMGAVNNNGNNGNSGNSGSSTTSADSSSSTDTSNSGSSSTDTSGSSSTDSSGASTASASGGAAVSANGVSSVAPASVSATASATDSAGGSAASSSSTAAPDSSNGGTAAVSAGVATSVPTSAVGTDNTPAATSAADQGAPSSSQSAAFAVPGQKIQVLPIGLGVFAGISVIALIVVGLVTYERTKYRKAFRARKLAESGAGVGYGGMAQR